MLAQVNALKEAETGLAPATLDADRRRSGLFSTEAADSAARPTSASPRKLR
jgi:hypothetical protein